MCLNPLFIRSSIPLLPDYQARQRDWVSIPYSSGHLFRCAPKGATLRGITASQSLIHQVIYSVAQGKRIDQEEA